MSTAALPCPHCRRMTVGESRPEGMVCLSCGKPTSQPVLVFDPPWDGAGLLAGIGPEWYLPLSVALLRSVADAPLNALARVVHIIAGRLAAQAPPEPPSLADLLVEVDDTE